MVRQILLGVYQIKVPLPRNPLKALNSYLIKGRERNLLIDTGFNWPACREALVAGMEKLGADLADTDFFITHVHADHSGLVYDLAAEQSAVYCSRTDADLMRATMSPEYWRDVNASFSQHGFNHMKIENPKRFIKQYISGSDLNFTYVDEGYLLRVGDYRLICVMTPGHTPGHVCLYEPAKKVLFAGDHILKDITSNITAWAGVEDSLGQYLASLDKISRLEIDLVLPGHREAVTDCRGRIAELKQHHRQRLAEILTILEKGAMNASQVASLMTWDMNGESWDDSSVYQKWFAVGEAIAHLDHLVEKGKVGKVEREGEVQFKLN